MSGKPNNLRFTKLKDGSVKVTDVQGNEGNVKKDISFDENKTILPVDRVMLSGEQKSCAEQLSACFAACCSRLLFLRATGVFQQECRRLLCAANVCAYRSGGLYKLHMQQQQPLHYLPY